MSPITFYFFKHLSIRRCSADACPRDVRETSVVRVMLEASFMELLHLGLRMNLLHFKSRSGRKFAAPRFQGTLIESSAP